MRLAQFKSYLLELDLFTTPVQLMIQKKRSHQTLCGAWVTLCCIVCIISYLTNKLIYIGDRMEFQTLYSDVFYEEPPYYSLNKKNFTLQFAFQKSNRINYINESIYIPKATLFTVTQQVVNGKNISTTTNQSIPITKCSITGIIQEELLDQLDDQDLSNTYCLDWNNINNLTLALYGTDSAPNYQYINVSFSTCQNKANCGTSDEISAALNRNYIHFQLTSYLTDLRNFDKPIQPKIEDIYTTISSQVIKDVEIFMQPITAITNDGFFSDVLRKDTTIKYNTDKEIIDFNPSSDLANIVIRLSNTESISYRIYPKVQDIFAAAGGLWQILFAVAYFIQKPFSQLSYNVEIINTLFNFEQPPKKQKKQTPKAEEDLTSDRKPINIKVDAPQQILASPDKYKSGETVDPSSTMLQKNKLKTIISKRFPQGRQQVFTNTPKQQNFKERLQQNEKINQVRSLFKIVSSNIRLKTKEYLQYLTYKPNRIKINQLDYSIKKVESSLDILFIIEKLQEIDKLKMILLNKAQMSLFEFLPKPIIYIDPFSTKQEEVQYHSSILKPTKSGDQKAKEAQEAFEDLIQDFENPITKQLIAGLDQQVVEILIKEYEEKNKSKKQFVKVSQAVINQIKNDQHQKQQEQQEIEKQAELKKAQDEDKKDEPKEEQKSKISEEEESEQEVKIEDKS